MKDKYLSIITNFGCHGECPYCIVRENGIKVPKATTNGLINLEDAIKNIGATIVSISGGGDPLHEYDKRTVMQIYYDMVFKICLKCNVPLEMHTSYFNSDFPYHLCKRVVYHLRNVRDLANIKRHGKEIVRLVFVATETLVSEDIVWIARFVENSDQIDELSFRQMVDSNYHETYYNNELLRYGHEKGLWHYIEKSDYNTYYVEGKIYTEFSKIGEDYES